MTVRIPPPVLFALFLGLGLLLNLPSLQRERARAQWVASRDRTNVPLRNSVPP